MPKLIKRDRGNYTNISNIVVRDSRLSWKARGIFLYLWSQANEWQFYVGEIATHATDGESALRSGLKELEQYGYLERNHRHNDSGSFDGMNWILTDTPEQDSDHHAENRNDAEIEEKPPKKSEKCNDAEITQKVGKMSEKASYAKPIRCETHPMQNRSLRNNNNKNYQYKEISNNKSSSSSNDEIKDPFASAGEADDDEEVITGLIEMFSKEAHVSIPNYQYNHIKSNLLAMDKSDAIDLMYTVVNKVNRGEVQNPIGYLITSITSVKGGD